MSHELEIEAETAEKAIEEALKELGVDRDQVIVDIIEKPGKGLLGLRKPRVKVKVKVIDRDDVAKETLEELVRKLGADASIDEHKEDEALWLTLKGESLAWLIGHHGSTLNALQVLATAITNRKLKSSSKIVIDIEGYRARRKKEVQALAERTVGKVLAKGEAISLRPMGAMERKIVHMIIGEYDGVMSASSGVEPNRFVVISPLKPAGPQN